MAEMIEQKNKLAYDKGRLQSRVDALQKELEGLANAQSEQVQVRKLATQLEAKYHKVLFHDIALAIEDRSNIKRESQKGEINYRPSLITNKLITC